MGVGRGRRGSKHAARRHRNAEKMGEAPLCCQAPLNCTLTGPANRQPWTSATVRSSVSTNRGHRATELTPLGKGVDIGISRWIIVPSQLKWLPRRVDYRLAFSGQCPNSACVTVLSDDRLRVVDASTAVPIATCLNHACHSQQPGQEFPGLCCLRHAYTHTT